VDEVQILPGYGRRKVQVVGCQDAFGDETLAEQAVLRHRKAMMFREREDEGVGVIGDHVKMVLGVLRVLKVLFVLRL
jgi:hypothetical protein